MSPEKAFLIILNKVDVKVAEMEERLQFLSRRFKRIMN
jgi:hypothetical protein